MKLGFIGFSGLKYDVSTPYEQPLGGSESAMCYLSEELAKRKHEVYLFTALKKKSKKKGVVNIPMSAASDEIIKSLDVLVVQNSVSNNPSLKQMLNSKTKFVMWTQHAHDQPPMQPLMEKEMVDILDKIVVISNWQKSEFHKTFNIPSNKMVVMRNAISPTFEKMFKNKTELEKAKKLPPVLTYTSTPFRGLSLLIQFFPIINQLTGAQLMIFSSMKVYQAQESYDQLYQQCKNTLDVDYVGSISQKKLAKELKSITMLSYPNTFAETSCIAVMEALASGCKVITSDLGALPETTSGFGTLIKIRPDWNEYAKEFVNEAVKYLQDIQGPNRKKMMKNLYDQAIFANKNLTWKVRAKEWEVWLTKLIKTSK